MNCLRTLIKNSLSFNCRIQPLLSPDYSEIPSTYSKTKQSKTNKQIIKPKQTTTTKHAYYYYRNLRHRCGVSTVIQIKVPNFRT